MGIEQSSRIELIVDTEADRMERANAVNGAIRVLEVSALGRGSEVDFMQHGVQVQVRIVLRSPL